MRLKITVHGRDNFPAELAQSNMTATLMLEEAVNSEMFKQRLLAMKFTNTKGMTNLQIYESIMTGKESLDPVVDYEADIHLSAYYKRGKVIGYTNGNGKIYVNTNFWSTFDYADQVGNMFHEWLHNCGWSHSSASDHKSVPYALGYLVEELVRMIMKGVVLIQADGSQSREFPVTVRPPERALVCYRSWRTLFRKRCYYVEV